jgi:F-type H+-transporting ATPase subunit b
LSLLELFTTAGAWASAAGAEHHAPSIHGIWFPLANFLIFAYLIKRFAIPPVRDFLRSRCQELLTSIQGAAESKQKAEAVVQDYKGRLARVDREIQSIQASLRAEGERQKTKLLQEAEGMAVNIRDDARFLADQEVKIARQKIRKEMAEQAEARARELVQRHLSASDQGRLVNDFIQIIGQTR